MTQPGRATAQTEYTAVTIIVVKAELQQQAENAAIAADPEGGAGTFLPGVPLRLAGDDTNTPVVYWCQWNMKPSQRAAFASNMGGPINIIAPGASIPPGRDRWLFDASGAEGWTGEQVLAALGYTQMRTPSLPN